MGTTLSANSLALAAMQATLSEVMSPEAYAHMEALAGRLEAGLGTAIGRAALPWHVARVGARVEFIFAPAQANTERLLRPQLRFHYAGDIPTYATSDAFEPDAKANEELDGLIFPDMPWVLGGDLPDAVRAATREAWPSGGPYRGRLFAFGFDAFRLAQALRHRGVTDNVNVEGLTGRLSLDADRRVALHPSTLQRSQLWH